MPLLNPGTTFTEASDNTDAITLHRPTHHAVRWPVLMVLEGARPERVNVLTLGTATLGRDPGCELALPDSTCSRRHAQVHLAFEAEGPVVTLTDLGSTNGTLVNGERVHGTRRLQEHDKVRVGATLFAFLLRDEQELEHERRLVQLATTDQLTGLFNRGAFDREIAREFDRCRRYGRDMALFLLDIDHFKRVNDTHGHPTGDLVLRQLGRVIQANLRTCDIPGRYGGEEFAVIFAETGPEGAVIAAERIARAVARQRFLGEQGEFSITVSGGIATRQGAPRELDDLVRAADRALYAAKTGGRNRVLSGDPAPAGPEDVPRGTGG